MIDRLFPFQMEHLVASRPDLVDRLKQNFKDAMELVQAANHGRNMIAHSSWGYNLLQNDILFDPANIVLWREKVTDKLDHTQRFVGNEATVEELVEIENRIVNADAALLQIISEYTGLYYRANKKE